MATLQQLDENRVAAEFDRSPIDERWDNYIEVKLLCIGFVVLIVGAEAQVCVVPKDCGPRPPDYPNCPASKLDPYCVNKYRAAQAAYRSCLHKQLFGCPPPKKQLPLLNPDGPKLDAKEQKKGLVHLCTEPECPLPPYEDCNAEAANYQECLARRDQKESQFHQCKEQRRLKCEEQSYKKRR